MIEYFEKQIRGSLPGREDHRLVYYMLRTDLPHGGYQLDLTYCPVAMIPSALAAYEFVKWATAETGDIPIFQNLYKFVPGVIP